MKKTAYILLAFTCLCMVACHKSSNKNKKTTTTPEEEYVVEEEEPYVSNAPSFDANQAYEFVKAQCDFGPRVMNSVAHDRCGDYIVEQFKTLGAESVTEQHADLKLYDGTTVKCRNIFASFNKDNPNRILICAHWDSRPWADHDDNSANHHTPIDGANDGASGVAVMLEVARQMSLQKPLFGVDFICFDAEDAGMPEWENSDDDSDNTWCLGSQYWAQHPTEQIKVQFGILLDMVGGPNSIFYKEYISCQYAPNIVDKVWKKAQRSGYGYYFSNEYGNAITDDHIQVNKIGIPCIDIIAADRGGTSFCKTWHTMNDNVQHIDTSTLKAVGQTLLEVLYNN